jgi:two-component system cell cycle sensor histidine kinase/response regulator CckA
MFNRFLSLAVSRASKARQQGHEPEGYAAAIALVLAATALRLTFLQFLGAGFGFITFYPAVMLAALYGGFRAGVLATLLSALSADYFLIEPRYSFTISNAADFTALSIFVAFNLLVSWVSARLLEARDRLREVEGSQRAELERLVALRTEQLRKSSERLRESEERFRLLVEQAVDGIFLSDAAGRYVDANSAGCKMLGYTRDEMLSRTLVDVLAPEEVSRLPLAVAKLAEAQVTCSEWRFRRKDGSEIVGEIVGRQLPDGRLLGIIRDITQRKLAEDALRKFSRVIEQTASSVIITDAEGIIEYVNPRFTEISGYKAYEVIGKRPNLLKTGQTTEEEYRQLWRTIKGGKVWRGEFKNRRKDGSLYWTSAIISPIRDAHGHITHFADISEDITQRKESEEALAAARRMEAVGQLAGSVTHDFNNLLTVIMGNLEFAKAHTVDERVRKHLLVALDAASVGASFSQRVLSLARKRTLEPVILDLNSRVKEAVKLIERVAGEHIVLNFRLGPELWLTRADRGEIDSALLNLAANARDAMPKGGTLTIETRNVAFHREEPRPDPQARDVDYVLLTVTDTGAGMSDEVLRRAGEPFFTTKKNGKGTGLGLSSVASFARHSGGFIRIESEVGKGTSVGIYLPRANVQLASEDAPASEEPTPLGNGELILVVEDDANVREITLKRLEGLGYAVTDAQSGPQAIELLRREGPVDLVFSDIAMPGGMTGYDIARWLSANQPAVKVVLATGYDPGHRVSEQQHDDLKLRVLNKPYSRSQLAQAIHETLNAA